MPLKEFLLNLGLGSGVGLILALVFCFVFPRYPWLKGSLIFALLIILFLWAKPISWFKRRESFPKRKAICSGMLMVGLLLEAFLCNYKAYPLSSSTYGPYNSNDASIVEGNFRLEDNGAMRINKGSYFILHYGKRDIPENVYIDFRDAKGTSITVKVSYSEDLSAYKSLGTYKLNAVDDNFSVLSLKGASESTKAYKLEFDLAGTDYYASSS